MLDDGVFVVGGKGGDKENKQFLDECWYVYALEKLIELPRICEGRYDMGVAVIEKRVLMLTGGFNDDHTATCERLNLKTMRAARDGGKFAGNFERIANLQKARSSHACCAF